MYETCQSSPNKAHICGVMRMAASRSPDTQMALMLAECIRARGSRPIWQALHDRRYEHERVPAYRVVRLRNTVTPSSQTL